MKSFAPRPAASPAVPAAAATPALADHRPAAVAQRQLLAHIAASPRQAAPVQRAPAPHPNATGLPDQLKAGIEQLSGLALDDVRVHYDSARPAQLQALAYAQGSETHLGPGQEKHLPHEAWHVVQQKQGRVRATRQLKGLGLNDDAGLEKEATERGNAATRIPMYVAANQLSQFKSGSEIVQRVVSVNDVEQKFDNLWSEISPNLQQILSAEELDKAKSVLEKWVSAPKTSIIPSRTSENRQYRTADDVVAALVGEVRTTLMKSAEENEAKKIFVNEGMKELVNEAMTKIKATYNNIPQATGRYAYHYSSFPFSKNLKAAMSSWSSASSLESTIALILDVSLKVRNDAKVLLTRSGRPTKLFSDDHASARATHWNPDESQAWTIHAREHGVPLSAGPSATTGQTMLVLRGALVSGEEMEAVAMAAHAFWIHKAFRHKSGIHTRYEVRDVLRYHLEFV